jgi:diguanylate cyclase (GGDEF)-like protein
MAPTATRAAEAGRLEPARFAEACREAAKAVAATTDPSQAVEKALDELHERLDGALVSVLALEQGRLWIVRTRGYTMIPDGIDLDEGVTGRAVRKGAEQYVADITVDPDYIDAGGVEERIVSELAIPLQTVDGIVGVLNIETAAPLPSNAAGLTGLLPEVLAPVVDALRSVRPLDLSALARYFVYVGSLRDALPIAEATARALVRTLPLETCQVLVESDGHGLETATWRVGPEAPEPLGHAAIAALRSQVSAGAVFDILEIDRERLPELSGTAVHAAVVLPLKTSGGEVGVAVGTSRTAIVYEQRQAEAAALVTAHAAASIDAALALSRERLHALTDPLTGLLNRRGFEGVLERGLEGAQEQRESLSLVVIDCDDFKELNDRAGHEFGDALLREVGDVLLRIVPQEARAARLGGDEFVVMLPGSDADEGESVAELLRARLASELADAGFPLRMSVGVSTYPFDGGSASQLVRAADQALYEAKAAGKGRVVGFREVVRRGAAPAAVTDASGTDRRGSSRPDASVLEDVLAGGSAIWAEATVDGVLSRLAKATTFVVGATGCAISRVEGPRLTDVAFHALRDVDLGEQVAYLIEEFPVTAEVLATRTSRALSFLDENLDRSEAFVLRELRMNACLLVPLLVHREVWGLMEVYDMRLRRFSSDERAAAEFLTTQAGRRIESLGDLVPQERKLFRLPSD